MSRRNGQRRPADGRVLITGGAGFLGTNLAHRLAGAGRRVLVYDNLARRGAEQNLQWLQQHHPGWVLFRMGDVRDRKTLHHALQGCATVFHLAAQVDVTTSIDDPRADFEINALGTLNLLEELRRQHTPPRLVFSSTNHVYGGLDDLALIEAPTRWTPADPAVASTGIDETRPLDLHGPLGCSKGAADQYVIEYARTFGIPSVVLRMSCIYGPHQQRRRPTLHGDGKQVRDVLFVEDLVEALLAAERVADEFPGRAFNIGGGPAHTTSLLELLDLMRELGAGTAPVSFAGWRRSAPRYYVSDTREFRSLTGWRPRIGVREGVQRLLHWLERAQCVLQVPAWRASVPDPKS